MAELLHMSKAGINGPLLSAPPAVHPVVSLPGPATTAWVPASPNPHVGFALDPGIRHKQVDGFQGAADAAAQQLGDDQLGRRATHLPTGPAAPYQKEAAQRAAERAIRPWAPYAGLGERQGAAQVALEGANAGVGALAPPDAPSLFVPPSLAQVNAVARAAAEVARAGGGQPAAHGAYAPRSDAPQRELWAVDLNQPAKYCTACRGDHDPSKVDNPQWQPYTPAIRLRNMQLLDTKFKRALFKGRLVCALSDAYWEPVRWREAPKALSGERFGEQMALLMDGVREGHEPYRYLATQGCQELLSCPGREGDVVRCVPSLVAPIKLCLNTMQTQLVGGMLLLLIRLLRTVPAAGAALAPYYRHLLPTLALFRSCHEVMYLPAPTCVAATGSFGGRHPPPEAGGRSCRVCGMPVDRQLDRQRAQEAALQARQRNASRVDDPNATLPAEPRAPNPLAGRYCHRHQLSRVVEDTLLALVETGGELGARVVRGYVPTFTYLRPHHPEWREQQQQQQRPVTSSMARPSSAAAADPKGRAAGTPPAGHRPASAGRAPSRPRTAPAGSKQERPRQQRQPATPGAADLLALWDGVEFRQQHHQQGGGGDVGDGGRPCLTITTPIPVFNSPHDPLFVAMASAQRAAGEAARRGATFAKGPARPASAPRGGAGGSGPVSASRNINSEVRYADSPAGLRAAFG